MGIEKKLISKKKPFYPISKKLENFLKKYDRWISNVISYDDLLRYSDSINIYDKNDKDTLWVRLIYNENRCMIILVNKIDTWLVKQYIVNFNMDSKILSI